MKSRTLNNKNPAKIERIFFLIKNMTTYDAGKNEYNKINDQNHDDIRCY